MDGSHLSEQGLSSRLEGCCTWNSTGVLDTETLFRARRQERSRYRVIVRSVSDGMVGADVVVMVKKVREVSRKVERPGE